MAQVSQYLDLASQARHLDLVACGKDFPELSGSHARGPRPRENFQSLSIIVTRNDTNLSVLFDVLTLPSLTHLTVTSNEFWLSLEYQAIEVVALLQQLLSLTDFTIHEIEIRAGDRMEFSKIIAFPITERFFDSFIINHATPSSVLLPRLKELDLRSSAPSFPTISFLRMVQSRWIPDVEDASRIGVDCLTSITLRRLEFGDHGKEMEIQLQALKKAGLRAVVL
ncbi:hypothetical protein D9758_002794 [Tetrapyrgos nigripes]|uniref:Uncharacterized protein n=1 Tax=Tetrapyrgos nigripes TaxID=182062 RepID=A0A8H5LTK1_9AGAR|nr:hypothetical protein D9758_002794 [Tetrapyrgos nigripes]